MGLPEAPGTVSVGLRSCYLALPRRHNFLSGFETAIWHVSSTSSLKPSQQLCHGTSRGLANCFCWPSKLQSGPSEVPQLSIGLRNRHLAFSSTLKSLTTFKTFPAALPWAPPRPQELFLLAFGFEAAIWHFRGTTTFYRASKLPSGTFPAPLKSLTTFKTRSSFAMGRPEAPRRAVSVGLRSCYLAFPRRYNFLLGFETAIWHFSSSPSTP